ncbi:MAG TPA: murein biosynthesis integral membrane protein MurJ [Elusimicrobia bacterium]|nr:murein biosynthesis integral membrane protein MurJ [Elusimicrobiota bacterium]
MTEKANTPQAAESRAFTRGMAGMTAANLVTKALGYVRDALLVAVFGAGALADAYYAAFRLVNVFRRTAGEGALNAVFIPRLEKEKLAGPAAAQAFFSSAWTVVFALSAALAACGILFREQFTLLTAWGFRGDREQFALTALLAAVLMPHLLFVNVSALFTAALNSARRFFLPGLAPAAFSLSVVALLLAFRAGLLPALDPRGMIIAVAAVASASGLIQAALLLPALFREGYRLKFSNPFSGLSAAPALLAAAPAAVTLAQDQVSLLINTLYASFLPAGAITAIYNSARLVQFPVSLFAAAAAAVSLPELAGRSAAGDMAGFRARLKDAMAASWLIMLPAAAGIAVTALPVCRALFEHGRFSPQDSLVTADALFWLAAGLPAYGFNKVAASSLYALGRPKAPLAIVSGQLALNALLCLAFMGSMGAGGLMLATSLSSWAAALAFLAELNRRAGFSPLADLPLLRPALAAAASALAALLLREALAPYGPLAVTAAAVPAAVAVYFLLLKLLRVEELRLVTGGRF